MKVPSTGSKAGQSQPLATCLQGPCGAAASRPVSPPARQSNRPGAQRQRRVTTVVWLAVLLPVLVSWLVVVAAACVVKLPVLLLRTTQRMVALAPGARLPTVQRGVADAVQLPWVVVTETKVGRFSVLLVARLTANALAVPALRSTAV